MKKQLQTPNSNRGFDAQILGGLPYWNELNIPGVVASIDNARVKFTYRKSEYDHARNERIDTVNAVCEALGSVELFMCGLFDVTHRESNFRIGNYQHTFCFALPDGSSFAVMVGRYCTESSVKQCAPEAVMDFNPNKVSAPAWKRVLSVLSSRAVSVTVQRFDLALDFPIQRSMLELKQRPGSGYQKFVDPKGAITEYTGERSHHGAVKLYDKSAEAGTDIPITRLEITIEPKRFKSLAVMMPTVHNLAPLELSLCFDDLPFAVQAVILYPELYDRLKATTSHNTWGKYKKMITDYGQTNFSLEANQLDLIEKYIREYIALLPTSHLS